MNLVLDKEKTLLKKWGTCIFFLFPKVMGKNVIHPSLTLCEEVASQKETFLFVLITQICHFRSSVVPDRILMRTSLE